MTGHITFPTMSQVVNTLWACGLDPIFGRISVFSFVTVDRYGI